MDNCKRKSSVASQNCALRIRNGIRYEDTKGIGPNEIKVHTDRKSRMKANIEDDKQTLGKGIRRVPPVTKNIAKMLYSTTLKSDIPATGEIHVQRSVIRSKRTCSETCDFAQLTTRKKLQSGPTKSSSRKSGIFNSCMTYELKGKSAWSSIQIASCDSKVSNYEGSVEEHPNKEVLGDLLKDRGKNGIKDERGVPGIVYDITNQGM